MTDRTNTRRGSQDLPAPSAGPARTERTLDRRTELLAAVVLSFAALLSSWAGFQASLWDGEQAARYSQAEQVRTTAARTDTLAGEVRLADVIVFSRWADAYGSGNAPLEGFYRARFRPEFEPAFAAWLATEPATNPDAPSSPFAMPDYRPAIDRESARLHAAAQEQFEAGQAANVQSDRYAQATVVLAMSLFMGGIVQAFEAPRLRLGLLALAGVLALAGLAQIAALPALWID